jgi:hypothetical protein
MQEMKSLEEEERPVLRVVDGWSVPASLASCYRAASLLSACVLQSYTVTSHCSTFHSAGIRNEWKCVFVTKNITRPAASPVSLFCKEM